MRPYCNSRSPASFSMEFNLKLHLKKKYIYIPNLKLSLKKISFSRCVYTLSILFYYLFCAQFIQNCCPFAPPGKPLQLNRIDRSVTNLPNWNWSLLKVKVISLVIGLWPHQSSEVSKYWLLYCWRLFCYPLKQTNPAELKLKHSWKPRFWLFSFLVTIVSTVNLLWAHWLDQDFVRKRD